jgi:translation initiation factor 2B subunit (eIF-2B alpha/beta/delta family)
MADLDSRIASLATDRESGASELRAQVVQILKDAVAAGVELEPIARNLLKAQPSMASVWNVIGHALAASANPAAFDHYAALLERAPRALARHAVSLLLIGEKPSPLQVVTISSSGTVLLVLQTVAAKRSIEVSCAEGRPALEGRRLAERLASSQVPVTLYSDSGLGQALDGADVVLVGADAISPTSFLNKSGTRMLAAAAAQQGVPIYVCATRDKFVSTSIAARLAIRDESAEEIWPSPPAGVKVRNRYFETTPLDLVTAVVSDAGVLGSGMIPDACVSPQEEWLRRL